MIEFIALGQPQTKGSAKAFYRPGMRYPVVTNDNPKCRPWSNTLKLIAQQHAPADGPWDGPISLTLEFRLAKPKSLPKRRAAWAVKKPDLSKLARAAEDALTRVIYHDDSQIVEERVLKIYGDAPGVLVRVRRMTLVQDGRTFATSGGHDGMGF